jgi:hypothetical protein
METIKHPDLFQVTRKPLLKLASKITHGTPLLFPKLGIRFAQQSYEGSSERDSISTVDVAFEGGFT